MDYQVVGLVFACIGALMSVLYLGVGVALLKVLRQNQRQPARPRPGAD